MHEKRLVERLKQYWRTLKTEDLLPRVEKFAPDVVADLWPRCLMLEVVSKADNIVPLYTYEYMGAEIINAYGSDLTGHYVNVHMHNFPGWQVLQSVNTMLTSPEPFDTDGSFVANTHKVVKYRAVLLPFGVENSITHVLVGISWKELG
jgi:hypothetical protein